MTTTTNRSNRIPTNSAALNSGILCNFTIHWFRTWIYVVPKLIFCMQPMATVNLCHACYRFAVPGLGCSFLYMQAITEKGPLDYLKFKYFYSSKTNDTNGLYNAYSFYVDMNTYALKRIHIHYCLWWTHWAHLTWFFFLK